MSNNALFISDQLHEALALYHTREFDTTHSICSNIILLDPKQHHAFHILGLIAFQRHQYSEAVPLIQQAIKLSPHNASFFMSLGDVQRVQELFEDATESYKQAINLQPIFPEAFNNLGMVLANVSANEGALICFNEAIKQKPGFSEAFFNRANLLRDTHDYEAALKSYDLAISNNPALLDSYWNKSLVLLTTGNYEEGWPLFEYRWKCLLSFDANKFNRPLWLGKESLKNKSILLFSEQGYGDTLQFCRYLPLIAALGAKIIFAVEKPLFNLMKDFSQEYTLITMDSPLPPSDFQCPLMSLPLALGTTLNSIPSSQKYLWADPKKVGEWDLILGQKNKLRVGLIWAGGARPNQALLKAVNERRNISLAQLSLLSTLDVNFYSLQIGKEAQLALSHQTKIGWNSNPIEDLTNFISDFSDTAALIQNLDLIISVDTSTAHLSAAMGKPTWILNRYDSCWRWLTHRKDSPWYDSVRLFTQIKFNDWDHVVNEVREELSQITKADCQ